VQASHQGGTTATAAGYSSRCACQLRRARCSPHHQKHNSPCCSPYGACLNRAAAAGPVDILRLRRSVRDAAALERLAGQQLQQQHSQGWSSCLNLDDCHRSNAVQPRRAALFDSAQHSMQWGWGSRSCGAPCRMAGLC
jgi:hypothetical protein